MDTKYIKIAPEIVLSIGDRTVFKNNDSKGEIIELHINIENWYGDDLLITNFNNCIVTEQLKTRLEKDCFTGFEFAKMKVTKDEYFDDNYQLDNPLPKFFWMKITGQRNSDDIFFENYDLYVSERMLLFLQNDFSVNNMEINPTKSELHSFILELIEKDKQKLKNGNK